ncbi:MAG: aminoglycoside phosphotransferase [Actinobacteria bacterium]|nr:aminoglycoside phosphotransferase [Actinomycetota bacterium]MBI3686793.1 aminoglycoside phosphotransferase [Actinomycetota bacterium]
MRANLGRAADHFGMTVTGEPTFGWRLRSIGARVDGPNGPRWLRVVSEFPEWAHGDTWTGNTDANTLTGITRPVVQGTHEWGEGGWRRQRAEVTTLLPGRTCSDTDVLRNELKLPDAWWRQLRRTVDTLRVTPTSRVNTDPERLDVRLREEYRGRAHLRVQDWETVHGDLHWNNLLQPRFALLDWELWGRGPAGTDPATLYCYSLLAPATAARVHETFADQLDTPAGQIAQLVVATRLLDRAGDGDHPDLIEPLRHHVDVLAANAVLGPA